jgi:tRNA nucleotidyltransferase (CCA-adding enzyme)
VSDLREQIEALPGMGTLLPALEGLAPTYLVGGAVRDLLRGIRPLDLDVTVEGDALDVAETVAERLGGEAQVHDRFGTATVLAPGLVVDFARTRRETYERPGALPDVEPATLHEDLRRRDFTVNAMAAGLAPDELGVLHDPFGGRNDLDAGTIRILHEHSFADDPTRLLRAVRYEVRLDAAMDPRTEELALEAIDAGALGTVSGKRIRVELVFLFEEEEMPSAVDRLCGLGIDKHMYPCLRCDPDRAASAALGAADLGAERALSVLAALMVPDADALHPWLDRLAFPRPERERVARAALRGPHLAHELRRDMADSDVHALLRDEPLESLAVALAWGAPGEPILRYVGGLRDTALEITGADLIAAGVPESPALGEALEETLRQKLDGRVAGRDDELRVALAVARRLSAVD